MRELESSGLEFNLGSQENEILWNDRSNICKFILYHKIKLFYLKTVQIVATESITVFAGSRKI